MQFRAPLPPPRHNREPALPASSTATLRTFDEPGTLRSINQSTTSQRQLSTSNPKPRHSSRRRAGPPTAANPEPIDYLQLRRTEQSKRAQRRTRHVAHEILSPAVPVPAPPQAHHTQGHAAAASHGAPSAATIATSDSDAKYALLELARSCRDNGQVDSTALAASIQQLGREQRRVEAQSHAAASQLRALLADIRRAVSLPRSFAPLGRIYARHKLGPRWRVWRVFVAWHRLEQQRVAQLAPFAVRIQRVFRRQRTKWTRAAERFTLAWTQWQAASTLQRWSRRRLRALARQRASEARYAASLQAAWRGRVTRRQVKQALQHRLRCALAALTPTGNLHRLHDVLAHSPPALVALVNHALSLVAETHVALADASENAPPKPRLAAIAAQHLSQPVEASRKQLVHAIHHVRAAAREREQDVAVAKRASIEEARAQRREQKQRVEQRKREQLAAIQERLAAEVTCAAMQRAELETREHVRALRTLESDARLRRQLRDARRAQAERSLMLVEEYNGRYFVAEFRRRALESRKRLEEVAKRKQFLHNEAQQQLAEFTAVLELDELKRLEAQQRLAQARAAELELWIELSKDEKANAVERLERREQERREAQRAQEARLREAEDTALEAKRAKDARRALRQLESARELEERAAMGLEDKRSRWWHVEARKRMQALEWAVKREKERLRYSLDPMHFARVQAQKQLEERERRERNLLALENARSAAVREAERKAQYFQHCREQRRQRLVDDAKERRERALLQAEEELVLARREAERRADAYKSQLQRMQVLAAHDRARERERLLEARRRREMHDEELRQRRVQQAQALADAVRERREQQAMHEHERAQREVDAARAKRDEKRQRATRNLRMMKEDVESMAQQDWEDEGLRLEQLLWSVPDAAAFAHLVGSHSTFLRTNVEVAQELVAELRAGSPPFELDYDAVRAHAAHELELPADCVPPKPRKPRRFFYHEFFEDDPILSRALKPPAAPTEDELRARAASHRARERWKWLGRHFFGHMWSSEAARRGHLQMHSGQYAAAFDSLHEAVRSSQALSKPASAALVRQLARCCLKLWASTAQRRWLDKSLFFLQQAAAHVLQLSSPSFLQEIALVLELAGSYRAAGEVLGGIIQCFPRYARLAQVVFRGAVVLVALRLFRQAREYLLHVLDAQPFGCWASSEVQFLVARVLQLEGEASRRLCEVAYEDAFRRHPRDAHSRRHATWQDWIRAAETWRGFGDACFAKREFVLARDAYQVMLKRQLGTPAHLVSKRQQVRMRTAGGHRPHEHGHEQHGGEREASAEDGDWLRLARVSALLNDRHKTELALLRWLERRSYRERVLEQFCAWPLVRWKLLGVEVPERIQRMRREKEAAREEAEAKLRQEIEEQRQQVLVRRADKARAAMVAWEQLHEPALLTSEPLGAEATEYM
ncbi:hypothetical protein PybrP1_012773 [[Pythium] brassicae (nom. inval.)]|nr:hypothetical protein PybrP1_012773 [[Pythium] brassicae (nom. inval.)]